MSAEILECLAATFSTDTNSRVRAELRISELFANTGKSGVTVSGGALLTRLNGRNVVGTFKPDRRTRCGRTSSPDESLSICSVNEETDNCRELSCCFVAKVRK